MAVSQNLYSDLNLLQNSNSSILENLNDLARPINLHALIAGANIKANLYQTTVLIDKPQYLNFHNHFIIVQ